MKIVPISVKLVHATPFPAHVIEAMGRMCYQSEAKAPCPECSNLPGGPTRLGLLIQGCELCGNYRTDPEAAGAFVRMLIKRGHESVLEHVSVGLSLTVDRGVTHEIVRHRIASFSQESTRFCNYLREAFGSEIAVIEPVWHKRTSHVKWKELVLFSEATYAELVADGEPPELARSVLPTCLKAKIGMTANAREWRHVLSLRLSPKAHPQMRQVMQLVAKELLAWCPVLFEDVVEQT